MHEFPLICEYKRGLPSSIQSEEMDQSKGSYEKAIDNQTDEPNERHEEQQEKTKRRSRTVKVAEQQITIICNDSLLAYMNKKHI